MSRKPIWLMEDVAAESIEPTLKALERGGYEYHVLDCPAVDKALEMFPGEENVIFCGGLRSAKLLRRRAKWIPGIYYNISAYDCVNYYAHLGKYLFNGNYIILPFGDLYRQKEFLYEHLGQERSIFLRPNRGDKLFTGKLVYKEYFDKDIESLGFGQIEAPELIVAAEPRNVKAEWRFVVANKQVIAGSQYKKNDRIDIDPSFPQGAFDLASEIAVNYESGDDVWVVDICETIGEEYKLMEVGCFSCAGLYQCDRDRIVKEVSDLAEKEFKEYQL